MSDYTKAFAISASGMALERLRLEVASMNLANAHTTQATGTKPFRPLRVVAHAHSLSTAQAFDTRISRDDAATLEGVGDVEVRETLSAPRIEQDAGNPDADARGFVAMPRINPADEMITIMTAVRAYEANVRAMNAAKAMALKALEIGGGK